MTRWPDSFDWLLPKLDATASRASLSLRRREYDLRLVEAAARNIAGQVEPYTMTDDLAIVGLIDALDHLDKVGVTGAFVECGVWRGGSAMAGQHCGCSKLVGRATCGSTTPTKA